MTYQESAEPLSFKQKAKRAGIIIAGIALFALGFAVRPGFDLLIAPFFMPKPYIAPVSDFDQAVDDYFNSSNHQALCHSKAKAQVSLEWANKYLTVTRDEQAKVDNFEVRATNHISDDTATKTITIEKNQGRR